MNETRALAIVAALLSGAFFSAGGIAGRMTAPVPASPPAQVTCAVPAQAAPVVEAAPAPEPEAIASVESPPAHVATPAPDVKPAAVPLPVPAPAARAEAKPKVEVKTEPKPKARRAAPSPRPRAAPAKKQMPSCTAIKREYDRMSFTERMAAYRRASADEIAYGRRCLGM
ncbi:hypothetical protein [Pseudomonas canadensis]|uniref:hypothetical protein n=1 Tax=Pseudomonas canadensis TaxID=915099 RepID=UPI0030DBDF88